MRAHVLRTAVLFAAAWLLGAPAAASAQTAERLYTAAQAQEQQVLATARPPADSLRRVALAYEQIVRRYPTSGYADNALWQAAGLLERAWELYSDSRDRDAAVRLLNWLAKEYPTASLARQARPRAATLASASSVPASASPPAALSQTPPAVAQTARSTEIRSITQATLPRGDRVTIELGQEVAYSGERVGNPDRVYFDFPNASLAAAIAAQVRAIRSPLIQAVRVGTPSPGVSRVVLELQHAPRFSTFPLYEPFRLVIDVEGEVPAGAAAPPPVTAAPLPPPGPPPPAPLPPQSTAKGDYSIARQLGLRVSRIVIDPGHGGHDPGAIANGITEAELVLDVALRLEKLLLQQPGVEVVLTRRTNEFVPLEERTAIANRAGADLFLSIHANSHRQAAVRGIETYVLNFADTPDAQAVAARENATSVGTMSTLPTLLKAISLGNKLTESRELARVVQAALVRQSRTHSSAIKDLGVKQAPFVVLIGAQMPSVLTELAFLTNRNDASLLKQSSYRQQMAKALHDGILKYQDSLKQVATVADGRDRQ